MYLKRKIDYFLENWKADPDHKPLIISGARQIGKTKSVVEFSSHYKSFININFVIETKYRTICNNGYDAQSIVKNISLINPSFSFIPGDTLILFDEIQDFPEIATSLKSFNEDRRFDVICSGSMLGINYNRIESNSVGNKSEYRMESMDFEEFLWAKGYADDVIEEILIGKMKSLTPYSKTELDTFFSLFLDYCILGGMPNIVSKYIETGTFEGSLSRQKEILADYREDIRKYVTGLDKTRVLNTFNHIPAQLAKENKKYQLSKIESGARFKDYWGCVDWLSTAGLVNICYCLHTPFLPLRGNYEEEKYKLYLCDTGLLVASLDDEAQLDLRANRNLNVYKGGLYENIIGESLRKQGYDLFYYKRENSTLEEDFFVRTKVSLVPVEVKSTNGNSKSLKTLIKDERYPDIKRGIKFCKGNIGFENNIYTFPYFCSFLLKRFLVDVEF